MKGNGQWAVGSGDRANGRQPRRGNSPFRLPSRGGEIQPRYNCSTSLLLNLSTSYFLLHTSFINAVNSVNPINLLTGQLINLQLHIPVYPYQPINMLTYQPVNFPTPIAKPAGNAYI